MRRIITFQRQRYDGRGPVAADVGGDDILDIADRATVYRHGGTITVDSTPGVGTTFTVRLPLDGLASSERRAPPAS